MLKNAKPMVLKPRYRSRIETAKKGRYSYDRNKWAHERPSAKEVDEYRALMEDLAKTEDDWEAEAESTGENERQTTPKSD